MYPLVANFLWYAKYLFVFFSPLSHTRLCVVILFPCFNAYNAKCFHIIEIDCSWWMAFVFFPRFFHIHIIQNYVVHFFENFSTNFSTNRIKILNFSLFFHFNLKSQDWIWIHIWSIQMDCIEMTCKVWLDCIQQNDICLHGIHISILYKWSASLNRWDVTIECDNYDETFQFVRCNYVEKSICLLIQIDLIWPNIRIQHAISKCANVTQIGIASYRTKWPNGHVHTLHRLNEWREEKKWAVMRRSSRRQTRYLHHIALHMHCSLIVTIAQNKRCNMMKLKQVCESTKNNNNGNKHCIDGRRRCRRWYRQTHQTLCKWTKSSARFFWCE